MIAAAVEHLVKWEPATVRRRVDGPQTVWGLTPLELHDRYWASRGVQVVRFGERSQVVAGAELFLLTDPWLLTIFPPARPAERLYWAAADAIMLRLCSERRNEYVEKVITDESGRFRKLHRSYEDADSRFARVMFTPDRAVADAWQAATDGDCAWRVIKRMVPRTRRLVDRFRTRVYDRRSGSDEQEFVRKLVELWPRPDVTVRRAQQAPSGIWCDPQSKIGRNIRTIGSIWVGAGRSLPDEATAVGPAVLWDLPERRPATEEVEWNELEPSAGFYQTAILRAKDRSRLSRLCKRIFDVLFSAAALAITSPLYPLVALCIWFEDSRPIFFGQLREGHGGREFRCWKFRSMRKNAEQIKQGLRELNQADGPQFYIANDPRLTRVGRIIRNLNIDELPQFFNVLKGEMSVVGPRPSPRAENQYCPAWREARLGVRPGVTGLWQIMRTRRPGMDFQEWIKYDLEYVQKMGFRTDFGIICETIRMLFERIRRCGAQKQSAD